MTPKKIFIAGHKGMVGSALVRHASSLEEVEIQTADRGELDLCDRDAVSEYLATTKPDTVIIAAAKVGGIHANATYPADFLQENLAIALNLIDGAHKAGIDRLLFLGSSCIYPRQQSAWKGKSNLIREEDLLSAPLEPTNEAYAIAKIAGLKLCQHYRAQYGRTYHSAMPCNLYGPGDNYHSENAHVIPALIRRFHEAMEEGLRDVTIWGTGTPRREFLHVDDLARACFHLLKLPNPPDWINVGTGEDLTIFELAEMVAEEVGFEGNILTDPSKPDGTPSKLLDVSKLRKTGWKPKIEFHSGLAHAYLDFLKGIESGKTRL